MELPDRRGGVPGKMGLVKKVARSSKKFAYAGTDRKLGLRLPSAAGNALASAMRAYGALRPANRAASGFGKIWKKLEM